MQIEEIPLSECLPYWRNPRKNDAAVAAVIQSIKDYGFNQPLVLDQENVISVGHTRYKAAKQLELETVPVVKPDISPEKAREYRIADNKTAELAQWDLDNLIPELRELTDITNMQIFFGKQDLSKILENSVGAAAVKASADQITARSVELNEKFRLGDENRKPQFLELICPHCTETYKIDREYVIELMGIEENGKD